MPDEQFDSIDSIEKHYGKLRKAEEKADEPDEGKIRQIALEEREAKAEFRERAAIARELDAHRRTALRESGLPEDWYDDITGSTPEEIDASITKWKQRYDTITQGSAAEDAAAEAMYGKPIGNGGGNPPPPKRSESEEWIDDFQRRFEGRKPGGVDVQEIEEYTRRLGGIKLATQIAQHSGRLQAAGLTLGNMVREGIITQAEADAASGRDPNVSRRSGAASPRARPSQAQTERYSPREPRQQQGTRNPISSR